MDDSRPIFLQIAERIANDIIVGTLGEGDQIPSTNEFAAFLKVNPATALKGVSLLVDDGILEKRRGIGMFVREGAKQQLIERRRAEFTATFIHPLIIEARKLGIDVDQLATLVTAERNRP